MRKLVTTLFFLVVLAGGCVSAQSRVADKNLAKWSIGIKGGVDYYRVEPYATAPSNYWWKGVLKDAALQASWAAPLVFVEYTANHWFGVGLELGWLHYNRGVASGTPVKDMPNGVTGGVYYGHTADALIYGSVNLTNLVAPYRQGGWRVISVYVNGGLGGGWFHYRTPDDISDKKPNAAVCNGGENGLAFMGMASLTTAFNVSKVWELFLEGQYRGYTNGNMGGYANYGHSTNALALLVGVRWKLGGGSKSAVAGHERNGLLKDDGAELLAEATAARKIAEQSAADAATANQKTDDLGQRVEALENEKPKASKSEFDNAVKNLQRQIDDLRNGLANSGTTSFPEIKFKNNSKELSPESMSTLDQIFEVLNNDSWTTLEVYGYTDNVASKAYNQKLSEARANTVKNYLVKKGLDAAKIKAIGKGIRGDENTTDGRADNRRVDFKVSK